jgi:site-specific DNA recombinase
MARRQRNTPEEPTPGSRVILYRRVSALMGRGGDDFHSPDIQLGAMRRVTTGMREVAVIDDIDQTGRNFERAGIEEIRRLAHARAFDVLAVYSVSRIGRNVLESLLFLQELAKNGITIVSASEQVDTSTANGRLMLTMMLSVAQQQSDQIGDSWSHLIDKRARAGEHHGRPMGYTRVAKRLVPDPVMGPVVKDAFERYARDESITDISNRVATAYGKLLRRGHVKRMLRNPAYTGKVVADGELLPGNHEPLVTEETWRRVQDRLARETTTPPRHQLPTWSMVGLAVCPDGHRLIRTPRRDPETGELVMRLMCGTYQHRALGEGGCKGIGYPLLEPVEAEVLDQVAGWIKLLRTDSNARLARMARVASARSTAAELRAQITRARSAMAKVTTEWGMGQMPDAAYRESMATLKATETSALVDLARAEHAAEMPDPLESADAAEEMLSLWPGMLPPERVKALRAVVRQIVVRRAAFWREPEGARVQVFFL